MEDAASVVRFWCETCKPEEWYVQSDDLDATIRARFGDLVTEAQNGGLADWEETAEGTLALLILIDQFARNIHRGSDQSFAGDPRGRAITRRAVARDFDLAYPMPERQFFLMPLMHSEDLDDQDDGVRLMADRLGPEGFRNLLHAWVHREVIRRFGRFPYRNAALGRETTSDEAHWLENGGYGAILREVEAVMP